MKLNHHFYILALFVWLVMSPSLGSAKNTQIIFSNPFPEEQQPDELFSSYFARITRGGTFPGIYLKAPDQFAEQYRPFSRKSFWMGPLEKTRQEVTLNKFDLWGEVYKTDYPQKFLNFSTDWDQVVINTCGKKIDVNLLPFAQWPTCLRASLITEVLFNQSSPPFTCKFI